MWPWFKANNKTFTQISLNFNMLNYVYTQEVNRSDNYIIMHEIDVKHNLLRELNVNVSFIRASL